MSQPLNDNMLTGLEAYAVDITREAGAILSRYFGRSLDVQYKDNSHKDPVTIADKVTQKFLSQAITDRFPDHSFLGEEDTEQDNSPAQDFVWVVDPLDGTKNFVAGLPIYSCSVGVMYRGVPVVGAVFIPWPCDNNGVVVHARKGAGAFVDQQPISVLQAHKFRRNALNAVPGSLRTERSVYEGIQSKIGEFRTTGSIAYELAMTAKGVLGCTITTAPKLWDVAGGIVLVREAGGMVVRFQKKRLLGGLINTIRQEPVETLVPSWHQGLTTIHHLRQWSTPLALGNPRLVQDITSHI